jgi:cytidylate kinase
MEKRVARVVAKKNISETEAREIIAKVDTMRENYVKRFTGTTRYDSRNYDLVINAAGKSEEKIADQILAYLEM